jgi:2',3'-cyclic-nucleotide 2'-phosphodiesterase (5'-nucleotidase family)
MRISALFLMLAACLCARQVTVTVLATTDLHGNIYPYDYLTGRPAARGLAKIATLVKAERKTAPDALLLDCGDTIQGSPVESVYQRYVESGKLPLSLTFEGRPLQTDPMMLVMNYLKYDAMAVGNHEYNHGLKNIDKARSEAQFPWLSANTKTLPHSGRKPFAPYIVKEVDGVKVGIVGITTPAIPTWEKPENYKGYSFVDGRLAAQAAVDELRARHKADVIVIIAHSGIDRDTRAGARHRSWENIAQDLATIKGVDAIVFGHTHNQVEEYRIGDVLLTQPKNWGISLARLQLKVESKPGGGYEVTSKSSKIIPVTNDTEADLEVLRMAAPYHELTERYLNTVVAHARQSVDASASRIEDSAIIDAVNHVQMVYANADVSFASSFNPRAAIQKGPVTVRQIAALYLYDNELYAIDGNGQMVKDALENAARFFNTCSDPSCARGPLINSAVIGYNFDIAQGVSYEIDVTRPVGDRIRNLELRGKPLAPNQKLRIALNNYRAAGSNGYRMFQDAKVVWRSYEDIRELIMRYYSEHELPSAPDNNWRVVPEGARQTLSNEVRHDTRAVLK